MIFGEVQAVAFQQCRDWNAFSFLKTVLRMTTMLYTPAVCVLQMKQPLSEIRHVVWCDSGSSEQTAGMERERPHKSVCCRQQRCPRGSAWRPHYTLMAFRLHPSCGWRGGPHDSNAVFNSSARLVNEDSLSRAKPERVVTEPMLILSLKSEVGAQLEWVIVIKCPERGRWRRRRGTAVTLEQWRVSVCMHRSIGGALGLINGG